MMISKSQMANILKAYGTQKIENKTTKNKANSKAGDKKDKVELSSKAQEYQLAFNEAKNAPDIRTERIKAIKAKISTGSYDVKGEDVAEKVLTRAVVDELV